MRSQKAWSTASPQPIPPDWRPVGRTISRFRHDDRFEDFLDQTRLGAPVQWQAAIAGLGAGDFESRYVGSHRLPLARAESQSGEDYAIDRLVARPNPGRVRASLTFVSLNRLAELVLRANPHIRRALRMTYPFVFVDEFQDTTYAQYDFLLSAFADGRTAVHVRRDHAGRNRVEVQPLVPDLLRGRLPTSQNCTISHKAVYVVYRWGMR